MTIKHDDRDHVPSSQGGLRTVCSRHTGGIERETRSESSEKANGY